MNTQTSRDFERLSAYIDNELSSAEKAELEARLTREPQLKANLDDLRLTVRALRSLPTVKPPRNFTLTPEQAGGVRARRGPLFPAFRLAAALCVLLLAAAVARDVTTSGSLAAAPADTFLVQSAAATPVNGAASVPATDAATDTATGSPVGVLVAPNAAPLLTPTPGASGQATAGGGAQVTTETPETDQAVTPAVRASNIQPSPTPGLSVHTLAPDASAPASATPQNTPASVAAVPTTAKAATAEEATAVPAPAGVVAPAPPQSLTGLRLAEIVLAVLALALAAGAWLTRRG